jgi:hypothetical protein
LVTLLNALKRVVEEFAVREEKLEGEFRARSTAETRAFESAARAHAAETAKAVDDTGARLEADIQRREALFEQRKRRINQAHFSSRKRALEVIRQKEGKVKYRVQEGSLAAERRRDAGLAGAVSVHEEFQERLARCGGECQVLEQAALRAFRGYRRFHKLLANSRAAAEADLSPGESQLLEQVDAARGAIGDRIREFGRRAGIRVFRFVPGWLQVLLLLCGIALALAPRWLGPGAPAGTGVTVGFFAAWAAVVAARRWVERQSDPAARAIAGDLAKARSRHDAAFEKGELRFQREQERVQREYQEALGRMDQDWKQASKEALDLLDARPRRIDEQAPRVVRRNEQLHAKRLLQIEHEHANRVAALQHEAEARSRGLAAAHEATMARLNSEHEARWSELESEWKQRIGEIQGTLEAAAAFAKDLFPGWEDPAWEQWTPPRDFKNAVQFGRLEAPMADLFDAMPKDPRLALPQSGALPLPLLLRYPRDGSILFETTHEGGAAVMAAMNNILFRLLSTTPPGKLSFTIFDPVGLGQNFASLMHLADYEESHINSRIWTQANQLEEKLAELNEHIEKVIQMYLRNEYETIAEYNARAGMIAEKYHFLVIADFPVNVSDTAARRLVNIATSGPRCGVFTLIHWDRRHALPPGFVPEELRKNAIRILRAAAGFEMQDPQLGALRVALDPPPPSEFATRFLRIIGESGKDSARVEVPFSQIAPAAAEVWSVDSTEELRVPIGRVGATKLQYLELGKGTRQHALVAGKTGSGKSTLFHVMITNLALWCSPEQVEFYLVDFKKGVEFKCYANRRLPHAKVVAIESDRQFGLSVLQRVDEELRRRGDLFRKLSVQDLPGYRKAGGSEAMPRCLLIVDEFQEFFVEEDRVSQYAAVLLDRIVRQGRAFGIHVLLGSQTLGGAYTLARATIGQMVVRIALQCNEADAYLIMDQDNPAPRLLSRPGEGIYNDTAGSIDGNSPFQTVWLPESERDSLLAGARARADQGAHPPPGPFVFEGNAPANVRDNGALLEVIETGPAQRPAQPRIWLGAPNSIKGPTEVVFRGQSGSHLLIVGQSEERALTLVTLALAALSAQYPKGAVRFVLHDSTPAAFPHRAFLDRVVQSAPHEIVQVKNAGFAGVWTGLGEELARRASEEPAGGAEIFVLIHGLQNYRKLRQEDEFGLSSDDTAQPAAVLQSLISDGPARGIHVIATCDTYNNVNRFLGRKTLSQFEMRVLFQMSAADSASLIDAPDAATLGMHRALCCNDREGTIETFRPYAIPDGGWIEEIAQRLNSRR